MAFTSLAYLMDIDWFIEAYRRTRKDGAVGVDGVTAEEYEQDLEGNLQRLLDETDKRGQVLMIQYWYFLRDEAVPNDADALKTTRKFLIPLLEYFDVQGVTLRQGGHRVLKRR